MANHMVHRMILANNVREVIEKMHQHANHDNVRGNEETYIRFFAEKLEELLPVTLADMTREEQEACQWMQCDVKGNDNRAVIFNPIWADGNARIMWADAHLESVPWKCVTPRFDLPRMTWPSEQKIKDVPTVKIGDVIESADDPRLAALPVWTVLRDIRGEEITKNAEGPNTWHGPGYVPVAGDGTEFGPWTVRRIGLEADQ